MKKKISPQLFFAVMWKGICQVFRFLGRLIGYRENESYFKVIWRVCALCITVVLFIFTFARAMAFVDKVVVDTICRQWICDDTYWEDDTNLGGSMIFQTSYEENGRIYDVDTRETLVKNVDWVVVPQIGDSLAVFSKEGKRGYINVNTGHIAIAPDTYRRAWLFSDGVAAVEKHGRLAFIDHGNKTVIDNGLKYNFHASEYQFHDGFCVVENQNTTEKKGLIDKTGNWAIDAVYDNIEHCDSVWVTSCGRDVTLLTDKLEMIRTFDTSESSVEGGRLYVADADHMIKIYGMDGVLLDENMIRNIEDMTYYTGEIVYNTSRTYNEEGLLQSEVENDMEKNVVATSRCKKYEAELGWYGLISPEGRVVTKPIYRFIEAVGNDLYLCKDENYVGTLINGRGEKIR